MTDQLTPSRLSAELSALIEEAETLSSDYDAVVGDAVRSAQAERLDDGEAQRLFERILTILRTGHRQTAGTAVAEDIRAEAASFVAARRTRGSSASAAKSSTTTSSGGLVFHDRNALSPRPVVPVPTFNGQPIPLIEGYVDVTALPLWIDNHRVQLHVAEFREINHRDPDPDEMLDLMHGALSLPSLDNSDPFNLKALASSIARKGVERPPIVTWEGEPKDGNRRIAASRLVLADPNASLDAKEKARWIRVWQAPSGTTQDQFEAIVVALNFEPDHKEDWPEYVKARLVVDRYRALRDDIPGTPSSARQLDLRKKVAEQFAIDHSKVKRYLDMVHWAEDFEEYHTTDRGLDAAAVRYKSNDIFQWFVEIQAGRGPDKLIKKLEGDDTLREVVYDLMYDVLDSGLQVRNLHKVVADEEALNLLRQAHAETDAVEALKYVDAAIAEAAKNSPTKKLGFVQFLRTTVDRLGSAPPDQWKDVDTQMLTDLRRVFHAALGAIDGELSSRASAPMAAAPSAESSS